MWDIIRQINNMELDVIRLTCKSTKFDVNVSDMQNPVDFCGRFQLLGENIQNPFLTLENV